MNNNRLRVTKIFSFEMAHALMNYDGDCKNIHGHSYKLYVTLIGNAKHKKGDPKDGMVIDFKELKRMVKREIISKYDHALVLNDNVDIELKKVLSKHYEKLVFFKEQPTCELLLSRFITVMLPIIPPHIALFSMRLYETETSYAEWYRSDNI